ncbi:unnamed protein product [Spirodela intermedia]|uniref:Exocyst subunit Exo70 family protein n=1 Tax=Spirodela intermedia TaxID=51605 RepID=A0A7I8IPM3_SPIIN|nr:unnamed protein product [Spirodela intermedia]CAA6659917.1 unnamed protein product [Spirodela intermedia]
MVRSEAVPHLQSIADRMIRARYEKECCQTYSSVRREVLDDCVAALGLEKMSIEEVQKTVWTDLDGKMKKWAQAVKVVFQALLLGEKKLCDQIFEVSPVIGDICFTETAKGCVMQLLNFAEAVAIAQRSPEKLFRVLDMYDALSNVMPELQAELILKRLGDAAKDTLAQFEKAVQTETSRKPMIFGDNHPLTRYVMNYLRLLMDYERTLNDLLNEGERDVDDLPEVKNNEENQFGGSMSQLGHHVLSTISCLESNIEEKSKLYDDKGLQYVFLMNNIHYIVQKVKDSELRTVLGDNWVRKRRGQIRQYARLYLRASWSRILSYLRDEGMSGNGAERFKNFNLAFEEIHRNQTTWNVTDLQLREELRISISDMVIPAYRSFTGRFGSYLEGGRNSAKYKKYTPEDLERCILDLFEGSSGASSYSRRRH